jgi:ABC-2 type transport system permease protein
LLALFYLIFGYKVQGSLFLFFGVICLGALASHFLGAAIASRIRKSEVAGGVANVFFFPMMFLSGVYFRTETFPLWLKTITDYFSLSALNSALRKIGNQGFGFGQIAFEAGVLATWTMVCFAITIALFDWDTE